jgi:hypothetical protein
MLLDHGNVAGGRAGLAIMDFPLRSSVVTSGA